MPLWSNSSGVLPTAQPFSTALDLSSAVMSHSSVSYSGSLNPVSHGSAQAVNRALKPS